MPSPFTRRGVLVATAASVAGCGRVSDSGRDCRRFSSARGGGTITSTTRSVALPGSLAELWVAPTCDHLPPPNATPAIGLTPTEGVLLAGASDAATSETVRTNVATVLVGDTVEEVGNPERFPAVAVTRREGLLLDLRVSDVGEDAPLLGNLERADAADSIAHLPSTEARAVSGTWTGGLGLSGGV